MTQTQNKLLALLEECQFLANVNNDLIYERSLKSKKIISSDLYKAYFYLFDLIKNLYFLNFMITYFNPHNLYCSHMEEYLCFRSIASETMLYNFNF